MINEVYKGETETTTLKELIKWLTGILESVPEEHQHGTLVSIYNQEFDNDSDELVFDIYYVTKEETPRVRNSHTSDDHEIQAI